MKKFDELTPADFPGYDPEKIEEWMAVAKESNKNYLLYMGGLLFLFVIISIAMGRVAIPGLVLLLIVPIFLRSKVRKIEKELKMTRRIVMMARRGELLDPNKQNS